MSDRGWSRAGIGSVVALGPDGAVVRAVETDTAMYPRSANKPAQAAAMLRCGLPLDGAAGARGGESLRRGLPHHGSAPDPGRSRPGRSLLQNTPGWPLDEIAMLAYARRGHEKSSIAADCSGKHAAMLVTCAVNGWNVGDYLTPEHPLQVAIHDTIEELAGEPVGPPGVDRCGAPLFAMTLTGLARTFRALALDRRTRRNDRSSRRSGLIPSGPAGRFATRRGSFGRCRTCSPRPAPKVSTRPHSTMAGRCALKIADGSPRRGRS